MFLVVLCRACSSWPTWARDWPGSWWEIFHNVPYCSLQGLQQLANLGEGLAGILVGDDDDQEDNESEEDEGEDVVEVRLAKYNIKLK